MTRWRWWPPTGWSAAPQPPPPKGFTQGSGGDNNVRLKHSRQEGKRRLDEARQALWYLCEPVPLPRGLEQYLRHFCRDAADSGALAGTEPLRVALYKAVATFTRAYAAIAQELTEAGYSAAEAEAWSGR